MSIYLAVQKKMMEQPSTWLITGVAGFIGSHLLETLLRLNQKVVGLDDFSTGNKGNLKQVENKLPDKFKTHFKLIEGDIRLVNDCEKAAIDVDYILHHAAVASVSLSIKNPEYTNDVNVTGFINVLNAARKAKVKKVIYASSSAVYGDSSVTQKNEKLDVSPLSPYAVSKYVNELYAKSFSACYGLEAIGLRYFNVYGPRQDPKGAYAAVIPLWIDAILNKKTIYINGDGSTVRDFCYVDDVIQANLLAALTTNTASINKVYNIGFGMEVTLNDLLSVLKHILQFKNIPIKYKDFRKGDIKISFADISLAKNNFEFSPVISLQKGLITTINYYQNLININMVTIHHNPPLRVGQW